MKRKTMHIAILCVMLMVMVLFSFFITPYAHEWDPTIKQVSAEKLLVLKVVWVLIFGANIACTFLARAHKNPLRIVYLVLAALSLVKLVSLFFIS